MPTLDVPESHHDLLASPLTAVLTTVDGQGRPQSTAVWFLLDEDGALKTSVLTTRQKYRNLAGNPACTLMVMDPANPYRTLEIRADAELRPDPDKALLPKFTARYGIDVSVFDPPGSERVAVILQPHRVVAYAGA